MELVLCKTTDADNVINKTLTASTSININLKRDVDIINPVLILRGNASLVIQGFNYCRIPALNRNYFIRDITNISADLWSVNCECDVIETYKAEILASNARYRRKIKAGDYLEVSIDSSYLKTITKHKSDVSVSGQNSIVLSTVGNS